MYYYFWRSFGEKIKDRLSKTFHYCVFSRRSFSKVRSLINDCSADGYVWKGREGNKELLRALKIVYEGETFLSQKVAHALQQKEDHEITDYDIALVKLLSSGMSQTQISHHFKAQNVSPSSVSSVEKRLNRLKDEFLANNATHLVSIFKDQKLT